VHVAPSPSTDVSLAVSDEVSLEVSLLVSPGEVSSVASPTPESDDVPLSVAALLSAAFSLLITVQPPAAASAVVSIKKRERSSGRAKLAPLGVPTSDGVEPNRSGILGMKARASSSSPFDDGPR
jgi:hypothetical protein